MTPAAGRLAHLTVPGAAAAAFGQVFGGAVGKDQSGSPNSPATEMSSSMSGQWIAQSSA